MPHFSSVTPIICVLILTSRLHATTGDAHDPSKVKHTSESNVRLPPALVSPPAQFLNLIHINDVYDVRNSPRCLAKIDSYSNEDTMRLFSGDIMGPSIISDIQKGMQMVRVMQAYKFDFSVLGNHEFDYGEKHFNDWDQLVNAGWTGARPHKWLLCNFRRKAAPHDLAGKATPFGSRVINGQKVCAFGLVDTAWMEATKLTLSEWDYEHFKVAARRVSKQLRTQENCDLIFCITHMENASDEALLTDGATDANPDGNDIDFVFGGHDHIYYIRKTGERVLLKSGMDFEQFSNLKMWWGDRLDQVLVPGTNKEKFIFLLNEEKNGNQREFLFSLHRPKATGPAKYLNVLITRVPVGPNDPKDPGLEAYVKNEIDPLISQHLLPVMHIQNKLDTREKILFGGESPIMNLFADVGRAYFGGEVALVNVRMLKGEKVYHSNTYLRRLDFMRLFPYHEDKYVEVELTGDELMGVLAAAVPLIHQEDKRWLGLSGVTFKYKSPDFDEEEGVHKDKAELDQGSVRVNGEKVDNARKYRCVVISSMFKPKVGFKGLIGKVALTEKEAQREPIEIFDFISSIFEANAATTAEEFNFFKSSVCKGFGLDQFAGVKSAKEKLAASLSELKDRTSCPDLLASASPDALRRARFYSLAQSLQNPDKRTVLSFGSYSSMRLVVEKRMMLVL